MGGHAGGTGPVINQRNLDNMCAVIERALVAGATILAGGKRADAPGLENGFYMEPTLLESVDPSTEISCDELFGPVANLYRVSSFAEAVALANSSPYGLTSAIHTRDFDRAMTFCRRVSAGVATVNGGTCGSEPHMPFGGMRASGNGTREPGTEALDVYTELRDIYLNVDPEFER